MNYAKYWDLWKPKLWIALREGKIFTPTFVMVAFLFFHFIAWDFEFGSWLLGTLWALPLFVLYYFYEFPLKLRPVLWLPIIFYQGLFGGFHVGLLIFALVLYVGWNLFGIGAWHYHRKLGTPMQNYQTYWKHLFVHSGPTSENAQEQLPKIFLLLLVMQTGYTQNFFHLAHISYLIFLIVWVAITIWLHQKLWDWKPVEMDRFVYPVSQKTKAKRVILIVMEGCRKDRLEDAYTPFFDWLESKGTTYNKMETLYPARTYSTAASLYTGAYPRDHKILQDLYFPPSQPVENLMQKLSEKGKKSKIIGPKYLADLWGTEYTEIVETKSVKESNQQVLEKAKAVLEQEKPDFLALHFSSIDRIGKAKGPDSEDYREQIQELDVQLSLFYKWLEKQDDWQETLFIVTSNYGLSAGGSHGHLAEGERNVPFILHGSMFEEGKKVLIPHQLISVAPTIAHLLGVNHPKQARGKILMEEMKENSL